MSIRINDEKCVGCGLCIEACPGNLIKKNEKGKAFIRDCWGCTSCIKECKINAIYFFLGADVGGAGSVLSVSSKGDINTWMITKADGSVEEIVINKKDANKY